MGIIYYRQELLIKLINYGLEYDHIMLPYSYLAKQINIDKVIDIHSVFLTKIMMYSRKKVG